MRRSLRNTLIALLGLCATSVCHATPASAAVGLKSIGTFSSPVYVTGAPGIRRLLFVVEQGGTIRVLRRGNLLPHPFLDISGRVTSGGEQGLLSMAFDPNYQSNHRFYVYYNNNSCDNQGGCTIEVAQLKRSAGSAVRANAGSLRSVIQIPHPEFGNHNGGQLQFGPGGHLFLATGDGGSGDDPPNNAQNRNVLLGKMLRIDPKPSGGYTSPGSNPFAGSRPGRAEIFSLGLRNPWRFSFDKVPGAGSRLIIGDVGQGQYEEIDYVTMSRANGANFGWSHFEGFHVNPFGSASSAPGAIPPIKEYSHGSSNCAITGGYVMRDPALPGLRGRYFYGDFCGGQIRSLRPNLGGASADRSTGLPVPSLSSFGEDSAGRLYAASLGGPVYRLVHR